VRDGGWLQPEGRRCGGRRDGLRARAGETAHVPVEVAGLSLQSGMTKDRFTGESVVTRVSEDAAADAGVRPADIGVVELPHAFAPAALTNLEALGLAEPGLAASRLMAGNFAGRGDGPALNPSGGLLSRGHPPGRPAWPKWPRCCGSCGGRPATVNSRIPVSACS
jgi:hypothetical protein